MKKQVKKMMKRFCPPIFIDLIRKQKEFYGFYGEFSTWEKALSSIKKGYGEEEIFEKVKNATQSVRSGAAVFERDSVLFYEESYNFELLAALFYILSKDGFLSVADFGGALGSTYFQNRKLFDDSKIGWSVIEQKRFVEYGKKNISEIDFEYTIEECVKSNKIDCLLISSSLQYIDKPYVFLERFMQQNIPYVLFDKIPMGEFSDKIVLQKVPPEIYNVTYPAWIFSEKKLMEYIKQKYEIIFQWDNSDKMKYKIMGENSINIDFKGMLFKLKTVN